VNVVRSNCEGEELRAAVAPLVAGLASGVGRGRR
jgi:hypothetical protein